jgi:hypothetical protein
MPAAVKLRFSNTSSQEIRMVLEPWATEVVVESGASVDVVSSGTDGTMEVEYRRDQVVLFGWPGAILHLASNGVALEHGTVRAG